MEKLTDWAALWRELVEVRAHGQQDGGAGVSQEDIWKARAREFDARVKRRWARPDSSRDFILSHMDTNATVLDIGAGTGAWAAMLARRARRVTAVEPSSAMSHVMRENLAADGVTNVDIIQGSWPDAPVEPHDFVLCSHAMYSSLDFPAFVTRMVAAASRMCFMIIRAPSPDGLMAEVAQHLWSQPFDSPNFIIAYNILLRMGIYPSVLMEDTGFWDPRTSQSLGEALAEMRRHFRLPEDSEYNGYLMALLRRRLVHEDGLYVWPREVRSALVYWSVEHGSGSEETH